MATTIDHLSVDHIIHVIQDFTDARGVEHKAGEQGLITALAFSMVNDDISITWKRGEEIETMMFNLRNRTGPGNGRMKQYFEKGEYVPAPIEGRRFIPGYGYAPLAPTLPELTDELITTDARFEDGIDRVWALACRLRFDEADEQLNAIVNAPDRRGDNNQPAAESICASALLHAFDEDLTVHHWLRDRGIGLWYSWGSGATSGGEGSARAVEIRRAEQAFADLDRKLGR